MNLSRKTEATLLVAAFGLFATGAAMAGNPAPMPYPEPEPYVPVQPDLPWDGFYLGALGGIQSGDLIDTTTSTTLPFDATTFGGMAGYNRQRDQYVFGVELDVQFGSGSTDVPAAAANQFVNVGPVDLDVNYLVDLRGRLGMAFDNVLVYAAGGYTMTKISDPIIELKATGWNVGAGIDVAVKDDFFVGGEYVYRNLSGEDNFANPWDLNTHAFQLRAGYRF